MRRKRSDGVKRGDEKRKRANVKKGKEVEKEKEKLATSKSLKKARKRKKNQLGRELSLGGDTDTSQTDTTLDNPISRFGKDVSSHSHTCTSLLFRSTPLTHPHRCETRQQRKMTKRHHPANGQWSVLLRFILSLSLSRS